MNKEQCSTCNSGIKYIDYKNIDLLKKHLNPHARIVAKRHTSLCGRCQRGMALAIKRARFLGILPFIEH